MLDALMLSVFVGYLASLSLYFIRFETQGENISSRGQNIVKATLAAHAVFVVATCWQVPKLGTLTLSEALFIFSFLVALISYGVEWRYKARFLLLFSLPLVLLFFWIAVILSRRGQSFILEIGSWSTIHAGLILLGLVCLAVAVSAALMYLLQSQQLKSKHLGQVFLKLPSLGTLDRMHFTSLSWGVILFSIGILSGIFSAESGAELKSVLADPKVILSFLACFMYWLVLSFRLSQLRRGQKIAMGTVLIFMLLFVSFLSSNYGPSGFHKGV